MLFLLSVLCVFPDNVDVTATSWGARRHTLTARARARLAESETLSNYKNLREKLLDQIDDIYLSRISNPEQPVSNIEIILIQNW